MQTLRPSSWEDRRLLSRSHWVLIELGGPCRWAPASIRRWIWSASLINGSFWPVCLLFPPSKMTSAKLPKCYLSREDCLYIGKQHQDQAGWAWRVSQTEWVQMLATTVQPWTRPFDHPKPQFIHLQDRNNNSAYLVGFTWRLNEIMHNKKHIAHKKSSLLLWQLSWLCIHFSLDSTRHSFWVFYSDYLLRNPKILWLSHFTDEEMKRWSVQDHTDRK